MPREKSAGAVIFRREDSKIYYLLLHYTARHWDFPKGHIEKGEKEEDTIKREVKEETGIEDIKLIGGFKEWIKYFFRENYNSKENKEKGRKEWIFKTVTFYLAQTQTKEVKISFEHRSFEWLPYKEALAKVTYKNAKEILQKAHFFLTRIMEDDIIEK